VFAQSLRFIENRCKRFGRQQLAIRLLQSSFFRMFGGPYSMRRKLRLDRSRPGKNATVKRIDLLIAISSAERPKNRAHGASRGDKRETNQPRRAKDRLPLQSRHTSSAVAHTAVPNSEKELRLDRSRPGIACDRERIDHCERDFQPRSGLDRAHGASRGESEQRTSPGGAKDRLPTISSPQAPAVCHTCGS